MIYRVKTDGKGVSKEICNVLGVTFEGKKELLGIYVSESEGVISCLSILIDLQSGGVKDLLIGCIDNLKGSAEAILSSYP